MKFDDVLDVFVEADGRFMVLILRCVSDLPSVLNTTHPFELYGIRRRYDDNMIRYFEILKSENL